MNTSIREQLAVLFNRRNQAVHTEEMQFSLHFRQLVEEHSINLEELKALLDRGMRPGKALRRLLGLQMKETARMAALREYPDNSRDREAYIRGYVENSNMDETVQKLVDAMKAPTAAEEVHFATTPEEIEWVYQWGPESCMVDDDARRIAGICYGSNPHVAVAWIAGNDRNRLGEVRPAARCIVNLATRKYGRLYGYRSQVLDWGLQELGYRHSPKESPLLGERLFVPTEMRKEVSEWPALITVEGYPVQSTDPRLARYGFNDLRTWYGQIMMRETYMSVKLHAPYIDFAELLVETKDWEWKTFGGKKYYGCWMEVVKWEATGYRIVDEKGLDILPKPDWTGKFWEFRSHGLPMVLLDWENEFYHTEPVRLPREWQWEDVTA